MGQRIHHKFQWMLAVTFLLLVGRPFPAYGVTINQRWNCLSSALFDKPLEKFGPSERADLRVMLKPLNFTNAYEVAIVSSAGWRTDLGEDRSKQDSFQALLLQLRPDATVIVGGYIVGQIPLVNPGSQGGYQTAGNKPNLKETFSLTFTADLIDGKRAATLSAKYRDEKGEIVEISDLQVSCVGLRY